MINKYKVAKHFDTQIADGSFTYQRKTELIETEAALDGIYVLRTTCPTEQLTTQAVVRVYIQLKMAERAYRTIKDTLDVRPIRHHLTDRVEAHFFLFLLALPPPVRTPSPARADAVHRRHATHPSRPCRARPPLLRREHQGRQRAAPRTACPPTTSPT